MLHPDDALKIVQDIEVQPSSEEIEVIDSFKRILAEDVYTGIDYPSFDRAAMDGYAYRSDDDSQVFRVVEIIPAGVVPQKVIQIGECARI